MTADVRAELDRALSERDSRDRVLDQVLVDERLRSLVTADLLRDPRFAQELQSLEADITLVQKDARAAARVLDFARACALENERGSGNGRLDTSDLVRLAFQRGYNFEERPELGPIDHPIFPQRAALTRVGRGQRSLSSAEPDFAD